MTSRFRHKAVAVAIAGLLTPALVGCGRSAPEDVAGVAGGDPAAEPTAAGIRVVSDQTIVPPAPTTIAPITTTTVATTTPAPAGSYVVEPGDTLSVIAERFGVSVAALSEANGITDVNSIQPGQQLNIPAAATG